MRARRCETRVTGTVCNCNDTGKKTPGGAGTHTGHTRDTTGMNMKRETTHAPFLSERLHADTLLSSKLIVPAPARPQHRPSAPDRSPCRSRGVR